MPKIFFEEFGFHNYNVVVTPLFEGFKIGK
jgi:hypothetical protein